MKRFLITLGIFLLPATAGAAPLSPWVQGVLTRADAGISVAASLSDKFCDNISVLQEIDNDLTRVRRRLSAVIDLEAESQQLREQTVCFQSDRALLAEKLKKIQDEMEAASLACQAARTSALRTVHDFVAGAYETLIRGGMDPSYEDDRLRKKYPFQDRTIWDAGADIEEDIGSGAPLCPYTTDYSPRFIGTVPEGGALAEPRSYGCDATVLATIAVPLQKEAQGLATFLSKTDEFAKSIFESVGTSITTLDTAIALLTGAIPPSASPGAKDAPQHNVLSGCLAPPLPGVSPTAADTEGIFTAFPDYFSPSRAQSGRNGLSKFIPLPANTLPKGAVLRSTYDSFLMIPNAGMTTRQFLDKRIDIGTNRPAGGLGQDSNDSWLGLISNIKNENDLAFTASNIEFEMGYLDATAGDAMKRMNDASSPLQSAVLSLMLVTEQVLPKEYIPQLTYFLARSCVDGHCQDTLDAVAQRTFNPYCHPYLSGKYRENDVPKKCFCEPPYDQEDYCKGKLNLDKQEPAELQCGEPKSSSSSAAGR